MVWNNLYHKCNTRRHMCKRKLHPPYHQLQLVETLPHQHLVVVLATTTTKDDNRREKLNKRQLRELDNNNSHNALSSNNQTRPFIHKGHHSNSKSLCLTTFLQM